MTTILLNLLNFNLIESNKLINTIGLHLFELLRCAVNSCDHVGPLIYCSFRRHTQTHTYTQRERERERERERRGGGGGGGGS